MTLPPLLLMTDRRLVPGGDLLDAVAEAVRVGRERMAVCVAEEDLADRERWALCRQVVGLARDAGALALVSGRFDLARASEADGVVGGVIAAPVVARCWPAGIRIARCEDPAGARRAMHAGAHGVILGPVGAGEAGPTPAGREQITQARSGLGPKPFLLVRGGVRVEHAGAVVAAGASGVAVSAGVLADLDPGAAVAALLEAIVQTSR